MTGKEPGSPATAADPGAPGCAPRRRVGTGLTGPRPVPRHAMTKEMIQTASASHPLSQGPLAGRYFAAAAMVVFALIPYLALSAALAPLTPIISRDLHSSLEDIRHGSVLA